MKNHLILFAFLLFASPYLSISQDALAEYELTINSENSYEVLVKATFQSNIDTLQIHPACPNYDYPKGWSTFIEDTKGNLKYWSDHKWIVNQGKEITYKVDLSFVKEQWEVGNEQAGIYLDHSMFVVTRALFLLPQTDGEYLVKFNLPADYTVTTPWQFMGENRFLVQSNAQLNNNTLVWGKHQVQQIQKDSFTLNLVLLKTDKNILPLVEKSFSKILESYLQIFPKTPASNYLITVFPAEHNDGEAYTTSNAFTLKNQPSAENKSIWINQFAHELFHFWNGRMINGPQRTKRQWFSEGFTEYFANLALVQTATIDEDEFFRLTEKTVGLYYFFRNRQYPNVSLVEAGSKKSTYRFGVYNGGWCAAFVMDMMIREKYQEKTLANFMNQFFEKYGLPNQPYTYSDLKEDFTEFTGLENDTFFSSYIEGIEVLPVTKHLEKLGIIVDYTSYEGTAFFYNDPDANNTQKELKAAWLGGF